MFSAAVAIAYAAWTIRSGVQLAVDTPTYSGWADALIAAHFNFSEYLGSQTFVAPPILYLLWITVVAATKSILGPSWMTGVVFLNWLSFSLGAYALLAAVRRLTRSGASMLLTALLLLVAGDLLIFVPYVVSDVMFWAISTGVVICGVSLAAADADERSARTRTIALGSILIVVAVMFRPVAVPLIAFWLISIATFTFRSVIDRFATPVLVLGVAVAGLAILVHAYVLANPSAWPAGSMPDMLTMVRDEYRAGMFVHQSSPPMLVEPAVDVLGYARITFQKLLFFITPWLPHYSTAHTVINLLFFVPGYGLSIAAISNLRRLPAPQQRAVVVLALFVLAVVVFHAMTLVDSDHRYRLPILPAILMLAAVGLESVRRPRTLASIARAK